MRVQLFWFFPFFSLERAYYVYFLCVAACFSKNTSFIATNCRRLEVFGCYFESRVSFECFLSARPLLFRDGANFRLRLVHKGLCRHSFVVASKQENGKGAVCEKKFRV